MNGIIDIKGKPYTLIAERVRLAHETRETFEIVESKPIQIAERWVWQSTIRVNGTQYIGTAEVKLNAPKNLPDGTNPFECAETSAVGRALGFAGLGSVESIASAEEVIMAQAEQSRPARPSVDPDGPASTQQLDTIRKLQKAQGQAETDLDGITWADAAAMLQSLQKRKAS
jgi:hypothetical protein